MLKDMIIMYIEDVKDQDRYQIFTNKSNFDFN